MLLKKIKMEKVFFGLKLEKKVNINILNNVNYSVNNQYILDLIFTYNLEKIYNKNEYKYFNDIKVIDLLGEIIKEELKKDIGKTTEIYYRLVEEKKIVEFYPSDNFRSVFIIEDVLAIIKNKLIEFHSFYNTPISILHMNYSTMIKYYSFYTTAIEVKKDHREKIRTKILKEYFTFLLQLNKRNEFKYKVFENYEEKYQNEFTFNMKASPSFSMQSNIHDYIYDINELNKMLSKEDGIYPCRVLSPQMLQETESVFIDLFSVGSLDTMFIREEERSQNPEALYGFYITDSFLFEKTQMVEAYSRSQLFFNISDLNPEIKISSNFILYNGKYPATNKELKGI